MTENGLQRILTKIQNIPGPIMIIIKIEENTHVSKRVSLNTIKIRDRFMNFLKKGPIDTIVGILESPGNELHGIVKKKNNQNNKNKCLKKNHLICN